MKSNETDWFELLLYIYVFRGTRNLNLDKSAHPQLDHMGETVHDSNRKQHKKLKRISRIHYCP